jgi:hypothetical protein
MSILSLSHFRSVSFAAGLVVASASALAGDPNVSPTAEFFGFRAGPSTAVSGAALEAREAFLGHMVGTSSYGFEQNLPNPVGGFLMNDPDGTTNVVSIGGTAAMGDANSLAAGRFNTTVGGSRWLDIVSNSVSFTFRDPFAAIGVFLTDIGDFETELKISLRNSETNDTVEFDMTSRLTSTNTQNLAFWGYLDRSGATYNRMTISSRFSQVDRFGIDDITLGDPIVSNPVPRPGTLALAAAALGLMALRRRA